MKPRSNTTAYRYRLAIAVACVSLGILVLGNQAPSQDSIDRNALYQARERIKAADLRDPKAIEAACQGDPDTAGNNRTRCRIIEEAYSVLGEPYPTVRLEITRFGGTPLAAKSPTMRSRISVWREPRVVVEVPVVNP